MRPQPAHDPAQAQRRTPSRTRSSSGPATARPKGVWKIPVADLEEAGLEPTLVHPTATSAPNPATGARPAATGPTVLELVRSDRFGRLRAELAEAVAAAEIALLRAEAERWRSLADERAQALDRADTALKALTTAMNSGSIRSGESLGRTSHEHAQAQADGQGDIVAVPPLVRAEAMRYTATLQALHDLRKQQNRWWQFWRSVSSRRPRRACGGLALLRQRHPQERLRAPPHRASATAPCAPGRASRAHHRSGAPRTRRNAATLLLPVNASVPVGKRRRTMTTGPRRRMITVTVPGVGHRNVSRGS